MEIIRSITRT